ncbi:MAG: tetratricopeptide repeat protein [Bacteroidales bacterium]
MKRRFRVVAITAVAFVLARGAAQPRAASKWVELRSANFLLQGDAPERDVREVARHLEEFRETLSRLLPKARLETTAPTVVLVFSSNKVYEPFKPTYEGKPMAVPGYFFSSRDINYVTMVLGDRADPFPIVFHEFTHQMIRATIGETPAWFNEGIAEFYSTFAVSDDRKQAYVGGVVENYVLMLRDKFLPLAELFAANHASALYNDAKQRQMFYAESWALMHYMLIGKPERMPQMFAFLAKLSSKTPVEQACQDAFGVELPTLEGEVRSYVGRVAFSGRKITFSEPIDARASGAARPLAQATVDARLGDLLMRMNRPTEGEPLLQSALKLDPTDLQALLSMGELCLRQKKSAEALGHLRAAAASYASSFEAHQALGIALVRRTGRPGAGQLAEARKAFGRALELQPDAPESTAGLGWVLMLSHERLDEAQRLAERAVELAPFEPDHVVLLAQVLAQRNQFAAARQRLGPLMVSDRPEVREQARALMALIANFEQQGKGGRGSVPKDPDSTDVRR